MSYNGIGHIWHIYVFKLTWNDIAYKCLRLIYDEHGQRSLVCDVTWFVSFFTTPWHYHSYPPSLHLLTCPELAGCSFKARIYAPTNYSKDGSQPNPKWSNGLTSTKKDIYPGTMYVCFTAVTSVSSPRSKMFNTTIGNFISSCAGQTAIHCTN